MQRVTPSPKLRDLIRITRTDVAKLSRREAAELIGGSEIWWKQIENGSASSVTAGMLARMCYALKITPAQLRSIDQGHVADLVQSRRDLLEVPRGKDMVSHLMATPGLTTAQRAALVAMAQALLEK